MGNGFTTAVEHISLESEGVGSNPIGFWAIFLISFPFLRKSLFWSLKEGHHTCDAKAILPNAYLALLNRANRLKKLLLDNLQAGLTE